MFPRLFSGEKFHEIELKEHVGKFSTEKEKRCYSNYNKH